MSHVHQAQASSHGAAPIDEAHSVKALCLRQRRALHGHGGDVGRGALFLAQRFARPHRQHYVWWVGRHVGQALPDLSHKPALYRHRDSTAGAAVILGSISHCFGCDFQIFRALGATTQS